MQDIIFYDFQFNCIAVFTNFISFNAEKKYCGYGTAELHFSVDRKEVADVLEDNPYLFFVADEYSAIVTGWKIDEDIAIFGRSPEWLLTKRGVEPITLSEDFAQQIASKAVLSSAEDFIEIGEICNPENKIEYSTQELRILYDVVCEVLDKSGLGFKVEPDVRNKKFVFSVYKGEENICVFSPSNKNLYDMYYVVEKQRMVTASGWYNRRLENMGDWNANTNSPKLSDDKADNAFEYYRITDSYSSRFGLNCVAGNYLYCDTADGKWKTGPDFPSSVWVYYSNTDKKGAERWDAVLNGTITETEAIAQISHLKRTEEISGEVTGFEAGKDYRLGDLVRVQFEFGEVKKTEKKRITAICIYCDTNETGIKPIFESLEE